MATKNLRQILGFQKKIEDFPRFCLEINIRVLLNYYRIKRNKRFEAIEVLVSCCLADVDATIGLTSSFEYMELPSMDREVDQNQFSSQEGSSSDLDKRRISDVNLVADSLIPTTDGAKRLQQDAKINHYYMYISSPWSPQIYFTVRGADNFHIYLWIAKDLAWTQNAYVPGMLFGISAIAWCGVLAYHALAMRSFNEMYMLVALTMWLCANFVWMSGEVFRGDDDVVVPQSAAIMQAAISMLLLYYFILKPFKLLPIDEIVKLKYDEADLHPRFSYFEVQASFFKLLLGCFMHCLLFDRPGVSTSMLILCAGLERISVGTRRTLTSG